MAPAPRSARRRPRIRSSPDEPDVFQPNRVGPSGNCLHEGGAGGGIARGGVVRPDGVEPDALWIHVRSCPARAAREPRSNGLRPATPRASCGAGGCFEVLPYAWRGGFARAVDPDDEYERELFVCVQAAVQCG